MRVLLPLSKKINKRAISAMIAYVLLIAITVAISGLVYNWLRFYVSDEEVSTCPTGVNIIIKNYNCVATQTERGVTTHGRLTVNLKNKGTFSVDGYVLRVHDREGADFGLYTFNDTGSSFAPGEEVEFQYNFDDPDHRKSDESFIGQITLIEVQPFRKDGEKIICKSVATQRIDDCLSPQ